MRVVLGVLLALALTAWVWPTAMPTPPSALPGWSRYDRLCSACHGAAGDGRGPAAPYLFPAPRDFTQAAYKWRSTPVGAPPTDEDLARTIMHGAPGTAMPDFALAPSAIAELVDVVKAFGPPRAFDPLPASTKRVTSPPSSTTGAALWNAAGCATCHGSTGRGDGAVKPAPHDLTTQPLRYPRASDDVDARRSAIVSAITHGLSGTAMPGYGGELGEAEIERIANYVLEINAPVAQRASDRAKVRQRTRIAGGSSTPSVFERYARLPALASELIESDRDTPLVSGTWPGHGDEAVIFGTPVKPQGPPPATLAPAQASLSMRQCARCHAKQAREWTGSIHASAWSPGLIAQTEYSLKGSASDGCRRCHTPLAEQASDGALAAEGITCAGCHVREWTRHGPPDVDPSLLPIEGYPLKTMSLYERGDFCMTCHQLPPRGAVAGKPLLDTYREWLTGPYMKRGVQCQHCHMPNREHTVRGIHDPDTVKQAYSLAARAHTDADTVTVAVDIANIGAGHYFPTTPTPTVRVTFELLDRAGKTLATDTALISRDLVFRGSAWHERADTRIPPGESRTIARAWKTTRSASARITMSVWPDALYETIYTSRLKGSLVPAQRALYEQALKTAVGRRYVLETRDIPIRSRGPTLDN